MLTCDSDSAYRARRAVEAKAGIKCLFSASLVKIFQQMKFAVNSNNQCFLNIYEGALR